MTIHSPANSGHLIVYSPGIHTGGGIILLKALLESDFLRSNRSTLFLDARSLSRITPPNNASVVPVNPSITGRLSAEWSLKSLCRKSDTVICLHSLPPLFRLSGHTVCLLQNILHLGHFPLHDYPARVRLRLTIERFIAYSLKSRVDTYIVQTPTVKQALLKSYKSVPQIDICPFMQPLPTHNNIATTTIESDFVYIADGLPHKNHLNLVKAWIALAKDGLYPKLILTLTERDRSLKAQIDELRIQHGLKIENRGNLSQKEVFQLYTKTQALIFPSYTESFGLPLVEASNLGVPVIAPELDYVRDVCQPAQTFDPSSPRSIARAVERFLAIEQKTPRLYSADDFIQTAMRAGASESMDPTP